MDQETWMSWKEHLTELRRRLLWIVLALVGATGLGLYAAPKVLHYLKSRPPAAGMAWNVFSPWDGIRLYMNLALGFAVAVSLPLILYQIWAFVRKGLTQHERDAALRYIPYTVVSMLIGFIFAYYVVFPMSLTFMTGIVSELGLVETYGIMQYFGFLFNIVFPLTLAFELPVAVMFLTRIGLLEPRLLQRMRRQAYLGLVILATLISPPELVSHLMVFLPLVALYEFSIVLALATSKRREKARGVLAGEGAR